jgi:transcriptional regulator with PAS, ATPase and Fis domain
MVIAGEAMRGLLANAYNIADCDAAVLISGESGTGKELLAAYIHNNSARAEKEFVAINCAALPENLLESELFGFEKGAFSGAGAEKRGLIELAHGGTLLLDEIDSMPLALQGKLLRVIETKQVRRLGAVHSRHVDFRLITTTNANLEEAIRNREFRLDLYHRLNVIPFCIPPLRNRVDEIRPLCEHFLTINCEKYHRKKRFSEEMIRRLEQYDWPGNIRELRNFVERAILMTDSHIELLNEAPTLCFFGKTEGVLTKTTAAGLPNPNLASDTKSDPAAFPIEFDPEKSFKDYVRDYEKWLAIQAVQRYGSLEKAAKRLLIDKSTLIRKRK